MAEARSPIRSRKFVWIVVAAFGVVVALTVASYVLRARSIEGNGPAVTDEDIAQISLISTVEQLAAATGAEPWAETELCVEYADGPYDMVCFYWEHGHPEHVSSFSFQGTENHADFDRLVPRLEEALARRLVPTQDGRLFLWGDAWMRVNDSATLFSASVSPSDDHDWNYQIELFWRIAQAAVHDRSPDIDETTRRQWLGLGYPLTTLATIDLSTTADQIQSDILAQVPASLEVSTLSSSSLHREVLIAVDDPWLFNARLEWDDQAGSMTGVLFKPLRDIDLPTQAFEGCIRDAFDARMLHTDNALYWTIDGLGRVHFFKTAISIHPETPSPSQAAWATFLRALDTCPAPPPDAAE